jgi:hypothetical protein
VSWIPATKDINSKNEKPHEALVSSFISMEVEQSIVPILDGAEVLPEHIESMCVHAGDRHTVITALLLSRCPAYLAKRVLLGDVKDVVMSCNNPLTSVMLGHQISRYPSSIYLTIIYPHSLTRIADGKRGV